MNRKIVTRWSSELNQPGYPAPEMHSEGLNIKMFQIKQGGFASLVISGTEQKK
jgi:hypothetical protein